MNNKFITRIIKKESNRFANHLIEVFKSLCVEPLGFNAATKKS